MDKLDNYRRIISNILKKQAKFKAGTGNIDEYAICDRETDNYILFNVGWHNSGRRQFGYPIHIRIKDGKVLVEWDGTNQSIVEQLIDDGIDENDIVWNFDRPQNILKAA